MKKSRLVLSIKQRVARWLLKDENCQKLVIPMGLPGQWRRILKIGNHGADVAAWQTVLIDAELDLTDQVGQFGQTTHNATLSHQMAYGLTIDGIVGPKTRETIGADRPAPAKQRPVLTDIPFVEAVNWSRRIPPRDHVDLLVIHCMEGGETSTRAERCAARFGDPRGAPKASCHYCIDNNSIVQCVQEDRVAWHAPGANKFGIGIEHAGFARQTGVQWLDPYGKKMLSNSARLAADICQRWDLPIKYIGAYGLKKGRRGITTHADVSKAFGKSTHWDPGPHFPMDWYIDQVQRIAGVA